MLEAIKRADECRLAMEATNLSLRAEILKANADDINAGIKYVQKQHKSLKAELGSNPDKFHHKLIEKLLCRLCAISNPDQRSFMERMI